MKQYELEMEDYLSYKKNICKITYDHPEKKIVLATIFQKQQSSWNRLVQRFL